nr:molybdate ABC transporter substrate-binding protein [uncultured Bacillus sp.]
MKKGLKLIAFLCFLLIFATACTDNKTSDASSSKDKAQSDSKEKVELTISAAASLKDALDVIQTDYQEDHPEVTLKFNYGSSGSLQKQISEGAPVDLFFSAAEDKFDQLVEEGSITKEDGVDLLGNELVLIVPKESDAAVNSFEHLATAELNQLSIGTPETVPAGQYAKESLEKLQVWDKIESKVVFAKDVRQVLSYVETGNVDAGIVYKTDALISDKTKIVATADPSTHTPIIYPVGVIKESAHFKEAKEFYNYLQSDAALKVFEEYGFTIQ